MLNSVARIERTQILGIVFIAFYAADDYQVGFDFEFLRGCIQMINTEIPIRPVANYNLFQDSAWKQVFDLWDVMLSPFLKLRSRNICGE
jgi:hypothetical protein